MKFQNGYWLKREGTAHVTYRDVTEYEVFEKRLRFYSSAKPVSHRGDTLNTPVLTTEVSSPLENVIRVQRWHFAGSGSPDPGFFLNVDGSTSPVIETVGDTVTFRTDQLTAMIPTSGAGELRFANGDAPLTSSDSRHSGYITLDGARYMSQYLRLSVGENVYGLGERFTPIVKNGQVVDIWNNDGGTSSEQSYKNIPFYFTTQGYGVFVNHSGKVSFEVGSEIVSSVQFSVPGEYIDFCIILGPSPKEVLSRYTALTGRSPVPPRWSFGLWLTTSFTTRYDEETVCEFIDEMARRDIPLSVFHFDCFWMRPYRWVDFTWDPDQFPDPPGMLQRLKQRGLHLSVWINPYVAQRSSLFAFARERGYLLRRPGGAVWQTDDWQAGMAIVDFTNPEAVDWYKGELKALLDQGIDTFKTDFGERIPTDVVYWSGADAATMHNLYTYLYNRAVFELLVEERGADEALVFARSATTGGQRFPVHWGGDCSATYESMAESLRGGLSLMSSGFSFWSHDIGGFEGTAGPDLFKRWIAFGALSTHSRLHGNESYRVPWGFDDEASDVLRHFVILKCRLMPYLYRASIEASEHGIPVMRPMVVEFPEDRACEFLDRQYMIGDALLVAPVFSDDGRCAVYLPSGRWTSLQTNRVERGGRWIEERFDYFDLGLYVRGGSIIPMGPDGVARPDYDYTTGTEFHVFEGASVASMRTSVQNGVHTTTGHVRVIESKDAITVTFTAPITEVVVVFRHRKTCTSVVGGRVVDHPMGLAITTDGGVDEVVLVK